MISFTPEFPFANLAGVKPRPARASFGGPKFRPIPKQANAQKTCLISLLLRLALGSRRSLSALSLGLALLRHFRLCRRALGSSRFGFSRRLLANRRHVR